MTSPISDTMYPEFCRRLLPEQGDSALADHNDGYQQQESEEHQAYDHREPDPQSLQTPVKSV
jgi:hypothetical protein